MNGDRSNSSPPAHSTGETALALYRCRSTPILFHRGIQEGHRGVTPNRERPVADHASGRSPNMPYRGGLVTDPVLRENLRLPTRMMIGTQARGPRLEHFFSSTARRISMFPFLDDGRTTFGCRRGPEPVDLLGAIRRHPPGAGARGRRSRANSALHLASYAPCRVRDVAGLDPGRRRLCRVPARRRRCDTATGVGLRRRPRPPTKRVRWPSGPGMVAKRIVPMTWWTTCPGHQGQVHRGAGDAGLAAEPDPHRPGRSPGWPRRRARARVSDASGACPAWTGSSTTRSTSTPPRYVKPPCQGAASMRPLRPVGRGRLSC